MIKKFNELEVDENIFNLIKYIYEKPTINIIINGETLNLFLLKSEPRQG